MNRSTTNSRKPRPNALLACILALTAAFVVVPAPIILWAKGQSGSGFLLGPTREIEPGVKGHAVEMPGGDGSRTLWIYFPSNPPPGKLPCVFIAPAGSSCLTGMALGPGDQPEQTPYAHNGFVVVAYSLDGNLPDGAGNDQIISAIQAFRASDFGVDDEKEAVSYMLRTYPQIDKRKLFVAGHSSAGTVALLSAEHDPRISGCAAYAPVGDLESRMGQSRIDNLSNEIPDAQYMVSEASPLTAARKLHCPVFIFHADDDANVPTSNVATFISALHKTNPHVYYNSVPTGGHYDSMRAYGIPDGIAFFTMRCKQIGAQIHH